MADKYITELTVPVTSGSDTNSETYLIKDTEAAGGLTVITEGTGKNAKNYLYLTDQNGTVIESSKTQIVASGGGATGDSVDVVSSVSYDNTNTTKTLTIGSDVDLATISITTIPTNVTPIQTSVSGTELNLSAITPSFTSVASPQSIRQAAAPTVALPALLTSTVKVIQATD